MASKSRQRMECASLLALLSVEPTTERRPPLAAGLRRLLPRKREQAHALQTLARIPARRSHASVNDGSLSAESYGGRLHRMGGPEIVFSVSQEEDGGFVAECLS